MRAQERHVTDAELVRRVRQGEGRAFDDLVARHRHGVLLLCRRLLGDWDLAEDAAQEALLEAARTLRVLRDPHRFQAWLRTIALHAATRQRLRMARHEVLLQPLAVDMAAEPPTRCELVETVRETLRELSVRDRQVMTLHYLEGLSCAEVAQHLGTTEGTVKRVLHESRARLRKEVGVVRESVVRAQGPRRMAYWVEGEGASAAPLRPLLAQAVCLCVNKQPKTARQIAGEVDANIQYVHETAEGLAECEILRREAGNHYRAGFIALDASGWIEPVDLVRRHAPALAETLRPHLPELREAWAASAVAAQGFSWARAKWPVIALLVLHSGIDRNAGIGPPAPPLRASGYRFWLGGREITPDTPSVWILGFNSAGDVAEGLGYGHFHTPELPRAADVFPYGLMPRALTRIAEGADTAAQVCAGIDAPRERVRTALAELSRCGLVATKAGRLRLTFPVFTEENSAALVPVIDRVCRTLLDRVLDPALRDLDSRLDRAGYGHLREQFPVWHRWMRGAMGAEALRHLIASRDLPRPAKIAPGNFCFIGWLGWPSVLGRGKTCR